MQANDLQEYNQKPLETTERDEQHAKRSLFGTWDYKYAGIGKIVGLIYHGLLNRTGHENERGICKHGIRELQRIFVRIFEEKVHPGNKGKFP